MRKNRSVTTVLVAVLSVFLMACGGGGSSSAVSISNKNAIGEPATRINGSKVDQDAVARLKEKEARQQAEAERQARLAKEKAEKQQNNEANKPNNAVQPSDLPDQTKPIISLPHVEYTGAVLSTYTDRDNNAWNGKNRDYSIELKDSAFNAIFVKTEGENQMLLPLADAGYYGQVTFTGDVINPDSSTGETMKAQITDLLYAYDQGKKDTITPNANMNYDGKLFYTIETEAVREASLDLTYHTETKTINGRIVGDNINMNVTSSALSGGDIVAQVKPEADNNNPELGAANLVGKFLDHGKYIMGSAASNDTTGDTRKWRGVFGATGTAQ